MSPQRRAVDLHGIYGVTFLGIIVLLILGTIALYNGAFESGQLLTVDAPRAGLTLSSGAPVKLRGVQIGKIDKIEQLGGINGDTVRITLKIGDGEMANIPSDVTAEIVPPTAFGAKYVQLDPGTSPSTPIRAGSILQDRKVTVEVDTAFENLTKVLTAARPAQVDAALTAAAEAVDQRGLQLGNLLTETNQYLRSFNPLLPELTTDINSGSAVAGDYANIRPQLVALARHGGVTAATLTQQEASLHAFALSLTEFDGKASDLLRLSGGLITSTVNLFGPVAELVARYSSELPCTLLGLVTTNHAAESAVGNVYPGINMVTRIVPLRDPYRYRENLPVIGDTRSAGCYGLPYVTPSEAQRPSPAFHSGANPYAGPQPTPSQSALTTLFGLLGSGVNLAGGKQ